MWKDNILLVTCLTSLSRESIVMGSTLVACLANNVLFTRALASLGMTVSGDRANMAAHAGLKLKPYSFIECKTLFKKLLKVDFWFLGMIILS